MFKLSMSSLELFHSNFLEWLFMQNPTAFLECFGIEVQPDKEYSIDREYHLGSNDIDGKNKKWITDIAVFVQDKNAGQGKPRDIEVIIENKIKSLPSHGQLEFQAAFADRCTKGCKKVLLTLFELPATYPLYDFAHLKYIDLVRNIRDQYKNNTSSAPYINDYCEMVETLQQIIDEDVAVKQNRNGVFTFHEHSAYLDMCGMQDAFRKYQAAKLVQKVLAAFGTKYPNEGCGLPLITGSGLNHKRACVDIFLRINENLSAGVQIEHEQFRVCFTGKAIEKLFDRTGKLLDDAYAFLDSTWDTWLRYSDGRKDYCKYGNVFVYRYVVIPRDIALNRLLVEGGWSDHHPELSVKYVLDKIIENKSIIIDKLCNGLRN